MSTLLQIVEGLESMAKEREEADRALRKAAGATVPDPATGGAFLATLHWAAQPWDHRRKTEEARRLGLYPKDDLALWPAECWRVPAEVMRRGMARRGREPLNPDVDLSQLSRKEKAHGRKIAQRMLAGRIRPSDHRRAREGFIELVARLWLACTRKPMGFARSHDTGHLYGACQVAEAACRRYLLPEEWPSPDQLRRALRAVRRSRGLSRYLNTFAGTPTYASCRTVESVLEDLGPDAEQVSREVVWPLLAKLGPFPNLGCRAAMEPIDQNTEESRP